MFQDLFQRVDLRYNFNNYDQNNDGVVDFLALVVIRFSSGSANGTTGLPGCDINNYWIQTNDDWIVNGQVVGKIRVNGLGAQLPCKSIQQRKFNGDQVDLTLSIFTHELGHALFGFTDISAGWTVPTGDDALGDFCNMSRSINFGNRPSMYNPILRLQSGWLNPTALSSGEKIFSDFLRTGLMYSYIIPAGNNITEPGQAFYFTFHDKSSGSYFEEKWPIPSDNNLNWRGIMIWNHLASLNQSTYFEWYHKPIDIVAAHGKWKWDLSDTVRSNPALNQYVTARNLYVPDPAKGMDSLEARYAYVKLRWNGTSWLEEGVYQDRRRGSASCFYDLLNPKEFSFYSNPNSNWYLNNAAENFSKTVSSNFKMSNLRIENGLTKANFTIGPNANVVSQNTSLVKGNWYFDQNITINPGITLTIEPGTNLYFSPGATLIVNGTLNAIGNSNNRTTFTRSGSSGTWGGIQFNSGSSGNIQYCTIQNATNGIFFNNTGSSSIQVSNCTIQNNLYNGLSLYNSSPLITNNLIIYNGTNGIYCNSYSSPKINYNTLKWNSQSGLYCSSYSSPTAALYYYGPGNNVIRDNYGYGIFAQYNCAPSFGNPGGGGNNSIFVNTSYEVCANYGCTVYAQYNYWGTGSTISAYQSTIYNEYPLPNDPNPGRSVIPASENSGIGTINLSLNYSESTHDNLNQSMGEILDDDEINKYKDIFLKERNTDRGRYALIMLEDSYWKTKKDGFVDFINKEILSRKNVKDELTVMAYELTNRSYIETGKYNQAVSNFEKIQKELLLNKEIEKNTLFNLGTLYLNCLDDKIKASGYFNELKTKFPGDRLAFDIDMILGELNSRNNNMASNNDLSEKSINPISDNYELKDCYPNPFNPTTTIRYQIPQDGHISLKVYDMLGREVAQLVNEHKRAGEYTVSLNGSKLSSGVYIYKLVGNNVNLSKKMLLMK